ncbi:isopentenyl-diphosphate Delta-isomerase [Nocardiopsis sp. NRRL B-16309]|uniref:isopentenyl-diphosphate Delta-isomerase n=1 Tax=Nocardiopsis sp. NRRL B-16309 TaxID=1519494 RepID=UPI0006AF51C0|nr:isopentenyl-diphosphate Delta-isomerase [Nocardiopsis sp. NRRL B-16309]KOX23854.1 isopentenyl-diphosphate delta-isomerase [Nocardiopsis sp. NRRL B-16309]
MPISHTTGPSTAAEEGAPGEPIMLELVDESGRTIGTAEKLSAHVSPGRLHRAFSVFLLDDRGRLLLQRRALGKYHSPGVWSNTCCGHPYPGEPPFLAAARRTTEELGVAPVLMREAGTVRYTHPDPHSGLVEQEYNHLFVGLVGGEPRPDPEEVAEIAFADPWEMAVLPGDGPFSAWFPTVLEAALPAVRDLAPDAGW